VLSESTTTIPPAPHSPFVFPTSGPEEVNSKGMAPALALAHRIRIAYRDTDTDADTDTAFSAGTAGRPQPLAGYGDR